MAVILKREAIRNLAREQHELKSFIIPRVILPERVKHVDIYNNPLNLRSTFCPFKDLN